MRHSPTSPVPVAMPGQDAVLEAEVIRLAGIASRIRSLARERGLTLDMAGALAVRDGLVGEQDWELLRRIFRATGAATGREC